MAWRTVGIGGEQGPRSTTFTFLLSLVRGVAGSAAAAVCGAVLVSLVQLIGGWETKDQSVFQVFSYLSMAIGGFIAARANRRDGWLIGGLVGILFILIINWLTIGRVCVLPVDNIIVLKLAAGFLVGAVGGIFGVNY
ncbi:MAG: TIGR04086 family membrane protein [Firmicutes bacterium]|nr:TIGR04086 family membrane protein [Bacillota bacterium]